MQDDFGGWRGLERERFLLSCEGASSIQLLIKYLALLIRLLFVVMEMCFFCINRALKGRRGIGVALYWLQASNRVCVVLGALISVLFSGKAFVFDLRYDTRDGNVEF